jgi:hypothetical protein
MTFFDEGRKGATFDDGVELALRFILADPQFLVRAERELLDSARGKPLPAGAVYRITDLELASRLSFFLWSSTLRRRVPVATKSWTRSGSRSRTSMPTRAGARSRAATAACPST